MIEEFRTLLEALASERVNFIVVGGVAGAFNGSSRSTLDLDVVYEREPENYERIVRAISPFDPYPRGAPQGLPFRFDSATFQYGMNFTLTTTAGAIDLLGEIAGGEYVSLIDDSIPVRVSGFEMHCLDLETLIRVKRAAGRPKDFDAIAELVQIANEQRRNNG